MSFIEEFNASDAPATRTEFDPVPAGWYLVTIVSAELRLTKAGNGEYIKLRFDIVAGEHVRRVLFGNINTQNPSEKAQSMGRQQLGTLMRAIGLATIRDTDQLVGGTLEVKVTVRDDPMWGVSNEVKDFRSADHRPATAAPKPATSSSAPWK